MGKGGGGRSLAKPRASIYSQSNARPIQGPLASASSATASGTSAPATVCLSWSSLRNGVGYFLFSGEQHSRLLLDGRLVHDNPILSMCMAHTTIRIDAAGNRAPDKRKATHRIDGTVALIMGLAMAPTQQPAIDVQALIG